MSNKKLAETSMLDRGKRASSSENDARDESVRLRFNEFAGQWRNDSMFDSSAENMSRYASYRSIIAMGETAVPLILRELQDRPDHWFEALSGITGEDPIPREAWGDLAAMTDACKLFHRCL